MKIVVAGGRNKADFLIASLLEKKHEVVVINDDEHYCAYLSAKYNLAVYAGNPCKTYVLEEADIYNADILIALRPSDPDNLILCQMAKKQFGVKKVVATVSNPKNVVIFQRLGVNTTISATYTIAKIIETASTIETLVNTLSLQQEQILLNELLLPQDSALIDQQIKELTIPQHSMICAILRNTQMLVPNGDTRLYANDKLLVLSQAQDHQEALTYFSKRRR